MRRYLLVAIAGGIALATWAAVAFAPAGVTVSEGVTAGAGSSLGAKERPATSPQPPPRKRAELPIYLTFDDGPHNQHTQRTLDILDRYGVRATFFVRGDEVINHPEVLAETAKRGHAIGNHTWSHDELTRIKSDRVRWQLTRAAVVITQVLGYTPSCMRPPYGSTNARVQSAIGELGLSEVLWHVDTKDWQLPSVSKLAKRIMSARPGQIVLMHDSLGTNPLTAQAVEYALPRMLARGNHFATIPSCRIRQTGSSFLSRD